MIVGNRREDAPRRREGEAAHDLRVAGQLAELLPSQCVPNEDGSVVGRRRDEPAVGGRGDAAHDGAVPGERRDRLVGAREGEVAAGGQPNGEDRQEQPERRFRTRGIDHRK